MEFLQRVKQINPHHTDLAAKLSWRDSLRHFIAFGNAALDRIDAWCDRIKLSEVDFADRHLLADQIDTGKIYGKVRIAETGLVDSTLIAVLHPTDNDSAIYKDKPTYYTRINGKGVFEFKYLPATNFNIYILPNDYNKRQEDHPCRES